MYTVYALQIEIKMFLKSIRPVNLANTHIYITYICKAHTETPTQAMYSVYADV